MVQHRMSLQSSPSKHMAEECFDQYEAMNGHDKKSTSRCASKQIHRANQHAAMKMIVERISHDKSPPSQFEDVSDTHDG